MKKNINHDNIMFFCSDNHLNTKNKRLLFEAFRRIEFLGDNKRELSYNMAGLGTPSQYKSPYFTPSFGEIKRVTNWYRLTKSGQQMVRNIYENFEIPKNAKERDAINGFLFSL